MGFLGLTKQTTLEEAQAQIASLQKALTDQARFAETEMARVRSEAEVRVRTEQEHVAAAVAAQDRATKLYQAADAKLRAAGAAHAEALAAAILEGSRKENGLRVQLEAALADADRQRVVASQEARAASEALEQVKTLRTALSAAESARDDLANTLRRTTQAYEDQLTAEVTAHKATKRMVQAGG